MVLEYFDREENFNRLLSEIVSWKGTKHVHRDVCIKGVSSNCARWVEKTLVNIGAIKPIVWPPYVTRNGGAPMLELLLETLDNIQNLERLWKAGDEVGPPLPKRGRLIVMSTGRAIHHLGIITNPPTVWHCLEEVEEANYFDSNIRNHLFAVYRVICYE